jgi:hypothetical protein
VKFADLLPRRNRLATTRGWEIAVTTGGGRACPERLSFRPLCHHAGRRKADLRLVPVAFASRARVRVARHHLDQDRAMLRQTPLARVVRIALNQARTNNTDYTEKQIKPRITRKGRLRRYAQARSVVQRRAKRHHFTSFPCNPWLNLLLRVIRVIRPSCYFVAAPGCRQAHAPGPTRYGSLPLSDS